MLHRFTDNTVGANTYLVWDEETMEGFVLDLAVLGSKLVEGGFIGLIGEKDIADGDGVARILVESGNDTAFDGNTGLGHNYCICQLNHSLTLHLDNYNIL